MPTIRDVARLAGVAPITVSRVINDSAHVDRETRRRVENAIQELGYVPNMLGPSLRFKQTLTLALVVTDITNPFWTTLTRGVEDVAQANGYSTILCNTDESEEKQEQYLQMLLRRRVDGILLVPASSSVEPIQLIQRNGIPVVVLDRQVPGAEVDLVRADSETGAYDLTRHLISLGHRQIAMLSGPKRTSTAVERVRGYYRAMQETGSKVEDLRVFWEAFTQESGYSMARQALASTPQPTAIFAANNFIAVGAMRAIQDLGYRVPEDIALVAVDDVPLPLGNDPFLTVAVQPALQMGQQAAQLLLSRIKKDTGPDQYQQVVLPTEMIIRTSSGGRIDS